MNRLMVVLLLCVASPAVYAGVYKWVDEDGRVHYGERPPASANQAKQMKLKSSPPVSAESREEALNRAQEQEQKKKNEKQQKAMREAEQAKAKENEEIRKHNCKVARSSLNVLTTGGRVFRTDDEGNRVYVSDADRGGEIESARKQVEKWCR